MDARVQENIIIAKKYHNAKDWPKAQQYYEYALRYEPEHFMALANLAHVLLQQEQFEEAEVICKNLLLKNEKHAHIWCNLAQAQFKQKKLTQALGSVRYALQQKTPFAEAMHLRGMIMAAQQHQMEAAFCFQQAIDWRPQLADAYVDLLRALCMLNHRAKIKQCVATILEKFSDNVTLLHNVGDCLTKAGDKRYVEKIYTQLLICNRRDDRAIAELAMLMIVNNEPRKALCLLQPCLAWRASSPEVYYAAGIAYHALTHWDEAVACWESALALKPDYFGPLVQLATFLRASGHLAKANEYCLKALALSPHNIKLWLQLAATYISQGNVQEGLSEIKKIFSRDMESKEAYSNYLFSLHYLNTNPKVISTAHQQYGRRFSKDIEPYNHKEKVWDRDKKLRIGYVSADFYQHSVSFFMKNILQYHAETSVCYCSATMPDEMTAHLAELSDEWHVVRALSDEALAAKIYADKIDILVDLSGHTAGNRLTSFSYKPAPVQITYLGYPDTTGLRTMDYRVTDKVTDPVDFAERYQESLLYVEPCFLCYAPPEPAPEVNETPCITRGHITFGCFNTWAKINEPLLAAWIEILTALPTARLLLKNSALFCPDVREDCLVKFEKSGIARERIELIYPVASTAAHLAYYQQIDVALDTYPYHGVTTSCEAIYMGVPVLTLAGDLHVSRVGVSLLSVLGLQDWIALDFDDYIEKAKVLTQDKEALQGLRRHLREKLTSSLLCNGEHFTQKLEALYRQCWHKRCDETTLGRSV